MNIKVSVYKVISVDGFIARNDGGLDWLREANATIPNGENSGFEAFMGPVDAMIMGRKTYQQVLSLGKWPYGKLPVVVLSRNTISFPPSVPDTVAHSSGPLHDILKRFSNLGAK